MGGPVVNEMESQRWVLFGPALEPSLKVVPKFAVFAHQGYFTVMINPTGSTTFGQGQCIRLSLPLA